MNSALISHRPLDLLEPLAGLQGAFACSPGALSSWAIGAAAGRRCVYARAGRLTGPLAERARALAAGGSIQINQARCTVDRTLFDFIATRTARAIVTPPVAIDRLPSMAVDVLDVLEQAAARGMRSPTNAQIGAAIGGVPKRKIQQAMRALEDGGFIVVRCALTGGDQSRTIKIIGTGETLCAA